MDHNIFTLYYGILFPMSGCYSKQDEECSLLNYRHELPEACNTRTLYIVK